MHSGIESRLDRTEKDVQRLFDIFNKKNSSAWAFVGTAVLSFLSMLVNVFLFLSKGHP
jgi:hypothetical protein